MNEKRSVSRRTSMKSLGIIGAALVINNAAEACGPMDDLKPANGEEGEQAVNVVELAVVRMEKGGHSCAQAVFSAFAEQLGLDYQTAVKVSSGFGGGMGLGSVCGAVTGSILAIGLKFGGVDPQAKKQTAQLVREFTDRFKVQRQSLMCRDLLGGDLSTPEGFQTATEKKLFAVCPGIVTDAAKILVELLNERQRKE